LRKCRTYAKLECAHSLNASLLGWLTTNCTHILQLKVDYSTQMSSATISYVWETANENSAGSEVAAVVKNLAAKIWLFIIHIWNYNLCRVPLPAHIISRNVSDIYVYDNFILYLSILLY
jgi:hypothetical protein